MTNSCDMNSAIAAWSVLFRFVLCVWARESINSLHCRTTTLQTTLPANRLTITMGQLQLVFLSLTIKVPFVLQ